MELIPESIQGVNTLALDAVWLDRLCGLFVDQLAVDMKNETDLMKLSLWLEQFGVPTELLPDNLSEFQFRNLLRDVLKIYKHSGTPLSITMLAEVLGATNIEIATGSIAVDHKNSACYNGLHRYDSGSESASFAITIIFDGMTTVQYEAFAESFSKLFQIFQHIGLHVNDIKMRGIYDNSFNSSFN